MKWAYDLTAAEPIIRDEPVFDGQGSGYVGSVTINAGALMACDPNMIDLGGASNAGGGYCARLAYSATVNSTGVSAIGVILETPYASGTSSSYANTTSSYYGKVIINPCAVYRVEQSQTTSDDIAVIRNSSATLESVAAGLAGHWVYFPLTAAGVKGSLRLLTAVSVTAGTMDSALTATADTSDTFILISPKRAALWQLNSASTKCTSGTSAATPNCTKLKVVETWIDRDGGLEVMKPNVHYALNNLHNVKGGNGPKFYYDVAMLSHIYK